MALSSMTGFARADGISGAYHWTWFDPRSGTWSRTITVRADASGLLMTPAFPAGGPVAERDVAGHRDHDPDGDPGERQPGSVQPERGRDAQQRRLVRPHRARQRPQFVAAGHQHPNVLPESEGSFFTTMLDFIGMM